MIIELNFCGILFLELQLIENKNKNNVVENDLNIKTP
tara:strand:+ start:565 stop:675 length:111 start_codon:yes stop_codon:yes gene_type:complete